MRSSVSRGYLALAGLQGSLSAIALLLSVLDGCGSCGGVSLERFLIAVVGCAAYAALFALGLRGKEPIFTRGIFVAAGVHLALAGTMLGRTAICPVCAAAAILAVLWAAHAALRLGLRARLSIGLAGAALLLAGVAWPGVAAKARTSSGPISVVVYENPLCAHCQEFRRTQAPRLEKEFSGRISLEYKASKGVSWVRLTPTLAIDEKVVFEGLGSYEALAHSLRAALSRPAGIVGGLPRSHGQGRTP